MEILNFFSKPKNIPALISTEAAECGIACLCMIANYYGSNIDINFLRQSYSLSLKGITLRSVMKIADSLNFETRAVRLEVDHVKNLKLPAILHWDLMHFVVLKEVRKDTIVINDPSRGEIKLSINEFSKHFTGVALEINPAENYSLIYGKEKLNIGNFWSSLKGFNASIIKLILISVILQIVLFVLPFHIQLTIDQGIPSGDLDIIGGLAIGFLFIMIFGAFVETFRSWIIQVFLQTASYHFKGNAFRHLLKLPSDYFEKRHVADIISRLGSTDKITSFVTQGFVSAIIDGLICLISLILLFAYSAKLTLITIAFIFIVILINICFVPALKSRQESLIIHSAEEQSHLIETIRASIIVKIMGSEFDRESQWRNRYTKVINSNISSFKFGITLTFIVQILLSAQLILVVYIGSNDIVNSNGLSIGMLVAFLSYRQSFTDRILSMVSYAMQFKMLDIHLARLGDILLSKAENSNNRFLLDLNSAKNALEFEGVRFRYGQYDPYILEDVSFHVNNREFLAITGPSGGGKTSLFKLMLGLQFPTTGTIHVAGQIMSSEIASAWRDRAGVVSQDDRLLSGTIADNISFFDPNLKLDSVIEAAKSAHVHDQIMNMPMQYLTLVGDMGSALSGGQKQRIILARALYRKPEILFLDEGTANLDVETENNIADLISNLNITRIVIAHRPALLNRADRIMTIKDGRVFFL